jgi:uroporphyrinogen-III synthase
MTRIIIASSPRASDGLRAALAHRGFSPVAVPAIRTERAGLEPGLHRVARRLAPGTWVAVTSAAGAAALLEALERLEPGPPSLRWAVVGRATARVVEDAGHRVAYRPARSDAATMGAGLPIRPGERVVIVRGDLAGPRLADALRSRGAVVEDVVAYRTVEAPATSRRLLREALAPGLPAAVVFTSGSTVRGLLTLAASMTVDPRSIPAVAIGPATDRAARDAGFTVIATATSPEPRAVASAAVAALGLPAAVKP